MNDDLKKLLKDIRSPRLSFSVSDARMLVAIALQRQMITLSRAEELLAMPIGTLGDRWLWWIPNEDR
jgi:predicted HTH domain antitoxin